MEGKVKKAIVSDLMKVVLNYAKQHTDAQAWVHASKNAQELIKSFESFVPRLLDWTCAREPVLLGSPTACKSLYSYQLLYGSKLSGPVASTEYLSSNL